MRTHDDSGFLESSSSPGSDSRRQAYRERLLHGLAQALAHNPYHEVTIADVVRYARTSRRTFYQEFRDRDECYFALLHMVHARMLEQVNRATNPQDSWQDQVRGAVTAYFDNVRQYPAVVRSWIRDLPSLGTPETTGSSFPREQFSALLVARTTSEDARQYGVAPISMHRAQFIIGGFSELTSAAVADGADIQRISDEAIDATISLLTPS